MIAALVMMLLIAGVGSAPAAPGADTCNGRSCIQVGTFNLYWLGSDNRSGEPGLRTQAEVEALVALVIDRLDLEVVVFQEVNTDITEQVGGHLEKSTQQWQWLKQAVRARGYRIVNGVTGEAQRLAIAYDKSATRLLRKQSLLVRTSFGLGNNCTSSNLRLPLAVQLQAGELQFWVVGLHLKSQIGGDCADRVRKAQAEDLVAAIDAQLNAAGEHVFLAGDFNAPAKDASLSPLRKTGKFKELTRKGQRTADSGKVSFLVDPFRALIDQIMYRKADSRRTWVRKSTTVFDPATAGAMFTNFVRDYSDHAPVFTSFYTDAS